MQTLEKNPKLQKARERLNRIAKNISDKKKSKIKKLSKAS